MDLERRYRSMNFNQTSIFVYIYIYIHRTTIFFLIFAKLQNVSSYDFTASNTCSRRIGLFCRKNWSYSVLSQFFFFFFQSQSIENRRYRWRSWSIIDTEARNWDNCRRFSRNERKSVFWPWFAFTAVRSSRKYAYEENTKRKFHLLAAETRVHFHGHFRNKYSSHLSPCRELSCSISPPLLFLY